MAEFRRTLYALFFLADDSMAGIAALLRGEAASHGELAPVIAFAILTGDRHELANAEFETLRTFPTDQWIASEGLDGTLVQGLVDKGLLLSDASDAHSATIRARDQALSVNQWNLYAALYHYMTRWHGVNLPDGEEAPVELRARARVAAHAALARHGPPPEALSSASGGHELQLPRLERDGQLYETLMSRRTTRAFDTDTSMTLDQLGIVLRYVFGCHGYAHNAAGVLCIKRTSPSGGGLHPIDVYPLITNVEGIQPSIYHYNAGNHSLAMLSALDPGEGQRTATSFMCGQSYFGAAHVSFILAARFYRNHWKYRRHQKAYAGVLMDAAHLSQTLYLVSTELGLGAFVTIAINSRDIEERLEMDGISEGVIAVAGCGPRASGDSPLELDFSAEPPN